MMKLFLYTKSADEKTYPHGLADSIHMAWSQDGIIYNPFNNDYGILFAEGKIDKSDVIQREGVILPEVFRHRNGEYFIMARRVDKEGNPVDEEERKRVWWRTVDFIEFIDMESELEHVFKAELKKVSQKKTGKFWQGSEIEIGKIQLENICRRWDTVRMTGIKYEKMPKLLSEEELEKFQVTVCYSDGSEHKKHVKWEAPMAKSGGTAGGRNLERYLLRGTIMQPEFGFPIAKGYGDPVLFSWKGQRYQLATNDKTEGIGLFVKTEEGKEHEILSYNQEEGFEKCFWAPEFHVIGEKAYILFAVSKKIWNPQCYFMELKENGCITDARSWKKPVRVCRANGSPLEEEGISLDMTYLKTKSRSYVLWSRRYNTGTETDSGSMVCIAEIEEETPWILKSEPTVLTRPLYGWENVNGTINNEGPYALLLNGTIYLTYSAGGSDDYTYAIGLLTANEEDDLLQKESWKKSRIPVISFCSIAGEYGPGHNSFFIDDDGTIRILYHAEQAQDSHRRCIGSRRIHVGANGKPIWSMAKEEDLLPEKQNIELWISNVE